MRFFAPIISLSIFISALPLVASADYARRLELSVNGGGAFFEGDSDADDGGAVGGRLGYNLTNNIGLEASWFKVDSELDSNNVDLDATLTSGELLFHANREKVRPFLALGYGILDFDVDQNFIPDVNHDQFVWGGGIKLYIWNRILTRVDARHFLNVEKSKGPSSVLFTAGLGVAFGGKAPDADGDGVADRKDECPGTPGGIDVNKKGCPLDSDGDGFYDYEDKCPATPKGLPVNDVGCADRDRDGVYDKIDVCPDTPEGLVVNGEGCSDRDEDGFFDNKDQCPDEPETVNGVDDEDGCPDKRPIPKKKNWIIENVRFISGSAKFTQESLPYLEEAYQILADNPDVRVQIQGHTDSQGRDDFNFRLSVLRAEAVKTYMLKRGIERRRLDTRGFGETRPIDTNDTNRGRARNRRIEFKVLD